MKGLVSRTFNSTAAAAANSSSANQPHSVPMQSQTSCPSSSSSYVLSSSFPTSAVATTNVTFNETTKFCSPSSPTSPSQLLNPTDQHLFDTQQYNRYSSSNMSHLVEQELPLKSKVGFRETVTGACKSLPMKSSISEINNNQHYAITSMSESGKSEHNRPRSVSFSRVLSTKHASLSVSASTFAVTESTYRLNKASVANGCGSNNLLSPKSQATLVTCSSPPSALLLQTLSPNSSLLLTDTDFQSLPYLSSRVEPGLFLYLLLSAA